MFRDDVECLYHPGDRPKQAEERSNVRYRGKNPLPSLKSCRLLTASLGNRESQDLWTAAHVCQACTGDFSQWRPWVSLALSNGLVEFASGNGTDKCLRERCRNDPTWPQRPHPLEEHGERCDRAEEYRIHDPATAEEKL